MITRPLLIIFFVCSCLFFYNLSARDFWAPDEGDFAEIVRELDNNYIVPHLNGKPYGEKPPLFYYIVYASKKALHWTKDETSMRIPSSLFALIGGIFFFLTIRKFFNRKKAILSTCILISAPLFYWQARYLQVDMVFAVFIALSLLFFFWFYHGGKKAFLYLFFICSSLAFMTKGPLSIILVFPVVLIHLSLEKDFRVLKMKETYIGILIFMAIILPWYLAIYFKEGMPYLYENIVRQNLTRFFDAWSHKRPIYYYLTTLPLDFFPWSLFLPMGIYLAATQFRHDPKIRFFLIWFFWMFVFLSISSGKISKYMLPVLPSIALITGFTITEEESKYNLFMFMLLSILFFIMGIFLFLYKTSIYPEFYCERILYGSLSIALSIIIYLLLRTKNLTNVFIALFSFMAVLYMIANISVYEKWNQYKSPKPMCDRIKPFVRDGTPWVYYGSMRGIYIYYIGTFAIPVDEHKTEELKKLKGELREFFILTRKRDIKEVSGTLIDVNQLFEEKIGDTVMVFAHYKDKM